MSQARRNSGVQVVGSYRVDGLFRQGPFDVPVLQAPNGRVLVWMLSKGVGSFDPIPYRPDAILAEGPTGLYVHGAEERGGGFEVDETYQIPVVAPPVTMARVVAAIAEIIALPPFQEAGPQMLETVRKSRGDRDIYAQLSWGKVDPRKLTLFSARGNSKRAVRNAIKPSQSWPRSIVSRFWKTEADQRLDRDREFWASHPQEYAESGYDSGRRRVLVDKSRELAERAVFQMVSYVEDTPMREARGRRRERAGSRSELEELRETERYWEKWGPIIDQVQAALLSAIAKKNSRRR